MQCVPVCKFPVAPIGKDPEDSTYVIEGRAVTLKNCYAEEPATPDSAAMTTTHMFKLGAKGDLSGDGRNGAPVLLVQNPGGSGSFCTNAILIGDRIAPQALEMHQQTIIVNYADGILGKTLRSGLRSAVLSPEAARKLAIVNRPLAGSSSKMCSTGREGFGTSRRSMTA
jgi:hypothetical protein